MLEDSNPQSSKSGSVEGGVRNEDVDMVLDEKGGETKRRLTAVQERKTYAVEGKVFDTSEVEVGITQHHRSQ